MKPEIRLSIVQVAGIKVSSRNDLTIASTGAVEVETENIPQDAQVWIGRKIADQEKWTFGEAGPTQEGIWIRPDMKFDKNESLVAIVTLGTLPASQGDAARGNFDWWRQYSIATSPLVEVNYISDYAIPAVNGQRENAMFSSNWLIWVLIVTIILGCLACLEYFLYLVSKTANMISRVGKSAASYIQEHFKEEINHPDISDSILGLSVMGLGIFAIWGYFPIYEHVLRTVLNLPRLESHSLALLLIVSMIMGGILLEVLKGKDNFYNAVLLAIALLILFQAFIYHKFSMIRTNDNTRSVPWAFAAGFISSIEVLIFYYSTVRVIKFIAWLTIFVFLLVFLLLTEFALLVEQIFLALPHKIPHNHVENV